MSKQPKTITRITWKNGKRTDVVRRGKWWHWTDEHGSQATSSHKGNVIWQAEQAGATIETVPNPQKSWKPTAKGIYFARGKVIINL